MNPTVIAVCASPGHSFRKYPAGQIRLLAGLGVEGDAHMGATTQHLYLLKNDPTRANLTQVHLLPAELHEELNRVGFELSPGLMGENITTRGIDLMSLPTAARLHIGSTAVIEVTGLRDPCFKLNVLRPGLMKAAFRRNDDGTLARNAGIMAIVLEGGDVRPGDAIRIELPTGPHRPLEPV